MSVQHPTPAPHQYLAPPTVRPTNTLAVVTLVLGLLGFAIIPVITGHVALRQIRERGDGGTSAAVVGLVLGYLALAGYLVALVVITGLVAWGSST